MWKCSSRSFFSFTLRNRDIVALAELRRCVLMPSGNNRFVVDKFSELVDTEIARPNRSRYSCVITLPVTASSRQNAQQSKFSGNSGELFYYKSKLIFTIALHFLTNVKYSQYVSTRLSVGIRWTILTAGHLVLIRDCGRQSVKDHCDIFCGMHKLAEFVHYKSIIIFAIAWLFQTNFTSSH